MQENAKTHQQTAFVTGSTGFVGLNLCAALAEQGWRVIALHRRNSSLLDLEKLGVEMTAGDILDPASLRATMPAGVDAVFHVAADINMWSGHNARQTATNVDGTRNVVEAALAAGAGKFILTSSISAYGPQTGPVSEATPSTAAQSWINYERSKWQAEEIVRAAVPRGLDGVIINPCAVFGPRDRHSWASMVLAIKAGRIKGIPPGHVPVSHVDEVVKVHIAAVRHGRTGENYILAGETVSFAELFGMIAAELGTELRASVTPAWMLKLIARLQAAVAFVTRKPPELSPEMAELLCSAIVCDTDKAARELGYRVVPVRECVRDCVAWLRAEGLV